MASFQPRIELLRKNISGSIDGDAIQNDITGARGTPPVSNELMTGITPQEQKGLKAPTHVARNTDSRGLPAKALFMYFDAPERLIITARGMVTKRYGQRWMKDFITNTVILIICSMISDFKISYHRRRTSEKDAKMFYVLPEGEQHRQHFDSIRKTVPYLSN